jgi:hypothetical protein
MTKTKRAEEKMCFYPDVEEVLQRYAAQEGDERLIRRLLLYIALKAWRMEKEEERRREVKRDEADRSE